VFQLIFEQVIRPVVNKSKKITIMKYATSLISRRHLLRSFAAISVLSAPTYLNANTFLNGPNDIRRVKMYSLRSGESIDMIYWIEGNYIKDALTEVDWFMRDLRKNKSYEIDTRTIDIISATQRILDTQSPLHLLSGYRTKSTNKLLRSRLGGGVAKKIFASNRPSSRHKYARTYCKSGSTGCSKVRWWWSRKVFQISVCSHRLWRNSRLGRINFLYMNQ
jgi:uncharacterized protein YcbK (DUF882 family)